MCIRDRPLLAHVFGSNNGIDYDLIHSTGDVLHPGVGNHTIFTRTPDYINDDPYNRILIIVERLKGAVSSQRWDGVTFYGTDGTFNTKVKIDNTGKIGILNTAPSYPLDVTGDINLTGDLRIGGVAQTFGGGGGGTSLWTAGTGSYNTTINRDSNVGISNTAPDHKLSVSGDIFSSSSSGFIGYGGNLSGISIQGERNNTIINFGIGSNTKSAYADPD